MMNTLPFPLIAFALALSFAGCAEMQWTKAGANNATVSRELDECRGAALRRAPPPGGVASQDPQVIDRGATPMATRPSGTSNERFIAEHDAVRQCMAQRGYTLTPAR